MPIDYANYPPNWKSEIRPAILVRAGDCCEGIPKFPDCRAANGEDHPETGSKVILTVAHLDHDPGNCAFNPVARWSQENNLAALCQRCHLTYDAPFKAWHRRLKNFKAGDANLQKVAAWLALNGVTLEEVLG